MNIGLKRLVRLVAFILYFLSTATAAAEHLTIPKSMSKNSKPVTANKTAGNGKIYRLSLPNKYKARQEEKRIQARKGGYIENEDEAPLNLVLRGNLLNDGNDLTAPNKNRDPETAYVSTVHNNNMMLSPYAGVAYEKEISSDVGIGFDAGMKFNDQIYYDNTYRVYRAEREEIVREYIDPTEYNPIAKVNLSYKFSSADWVED